MLSDHSPPFRGSVAVAEGHATRKELRGPRFRRLFADIYVGAQVEPDLAIRSMAAYLLVEGRGVLGGYSAAELLGASCGRNDAPAEVVVPGGRQRAQPGLEVRRGRLQGDEVTALARALVTSPLRTAYDLARRKPLLEAVVAVDALSHAHGFAPREIVTFGYRYLGARGSAQLSGVARLADPLAESPMETRIRLAIRAAGLPMPVLQHPVGPYRLDMAYPGLRLGVEYDGREHLKPERALRDLARESYLGRAGWTVVRFRAGDVLHRPVWVAAQVGRMIAVTTT